MSHNTHRVRKTRCHAQVEPVAYVPGRPREKGGETWTERASADGSVCPVFRTQFRQFGGQYRADALGRDTRGEIRPDRIVFTVREELSVEEREKEFVSQSAAFGSTRVPLCVCPVCMWRRAHLHTATVYPSFSLLAHLVQHVSAERC